MKLSRKIPCLMLGEIRQISLLRKIRWFLNQSLIVLTNNNLSTKIKVSNNPNNFKVQLKVKKLTLSYKENFSRFSANYRRWKNLNLPQQSNPYSLRTPNMDNHRLGNSLGMTLILSILMVYKIILLSSEAIKILLIEIRIIVAS